MSDNPLERLSKLPKTYRQAVEPFTTRDADQDAASEVTASWRTFSTSSAPSTLLSFYPDVHLYTIGRAINRLGAFIVNPIDNAMARRELRKVLEYLRSSGSEHDWNTMRSILESKDVLSRLLEAGR
jgi:hypothetical protein